jgi:hypothetical protein
MDELEDVRHVGMDEMEALTKKRSEGWNPSRSNNRNDEPVDDLARALSWKDLKAIPAAVEIEL